MPITMEDLQQLSNSPVPGKRVMAGRMPAGLQALGGPPPDDSDLAAPPKAAPLLDAIDLKPAAPAQSGPMTLSVGGGPAAAMPQAGDKDFAAPAPQAGTYYGPNNGYGMAPYRSDAEIKASGSGNPIQDRIMALLNSEPPSPVAWHNAGGRDEMNPNYGAQMADRHAQFGTLNELMKGQNESAYQDKHLALENRKQSFLEKEAARLKGDEPRRQAIEDKMISDAMSKPGGATPLELATIKKQVSDAFPFNNPAGAAAKPGQAGAPAGGTDINAVVQKLPSAITSMGQSAATPEDFATKLYQLDKAGQLPKGTNISDIMAYMNQKFTPADVERYLKPHTFLGGMSAERFHSGLGGVLQDFGLGTQSDHAAPFEARNAILNALGRPNPDQKKTLLERAGSPNAWIYRQLSGR